MKVLIISLTEYKDLGARKLQIANIVSALQSVGIYTYIITINNDHFLNIGNDSLQKIVQLKFEKIKNKFNFFKNIKNILFPKSNYYLKRCVDYSLEYIDKEKPDCIITSSLPITSHLAGLMINKKKKIPWIASFSDPRPISILPYPYKSSFKIKFLLQKYWISKVLNKSTVVHMPSKYGIELTKFVYKLDKRNFFSIIPHVGFECLNDNNEKYKNWIIHAGNLTGSRASLELLLAIKSVYNDNKNNFKGLICIGDVSSNFIDMIKNLGIENIVKLLGRKSQKKCMEIISNASVALVLEAEMKSSPFLPSKFADYARSYTPILAITPKISSVRDYLNSYGGGIAVSHSKEEIKEGLINILKDNKKFSLEKLSYIFSKENVGFEYKTIISKISK